MKPILFLFDYFILTYSLKITYIVLDIDFAHLPSFWCRIGMCLILQFMNRVK